MWHAAGATLLQSGDQYYLQHVGGRPDCGQGVEFLGFLNKTCQAGTKTVPYGPTCGPTLRGAADGQRWKQWTVTVVGQADDGNDLVNIENYYPGNKALCMGNMVPEKKTDCTAAPWAPRVHIHPNQPYVWRLIPVEGADAFQIVADSRAEGCLRFLGGSNTCSDKYVQLYDSDDGSGQQQWVLTPVKARSPSPPPPEKRSPPPPGASPPSVSPPPPANVAPSVEVDDVASTGARVAITPPPSGCAPLSYEVSYATAPISGGAPAPMVQALPAGNLAVWLNLWPGETYTATTVGICADGVRTPRSAPATFTTPATSGTPPPPRATCATKEWAPYGHRQCGNAASLCLKSATPSAAYSNDELVNVTMKFTGWGGGNITCWASNVEATVASWNNWGNVWNTTLVPCSSSSCVDDQTATGTAVASVNGAAEVVIPALWVSDGNSGQVNFQVVCAARPEYDDPANCNAHPPILTTVSADRTCFPADAVVQRVKPSTGAKSPARMDQLAIGDYVECLVPQYNATGETGYTYGTCQVYYYFNKQSPWYAYYYFTYATLGGGTGVFRASPQHNIFVAGAASGLAAAPPPGSGVESTKVKVGDLLAIQDPATKLYYTTPVTGIKVTGAAGAYTPMLTNAGLPIVDGAVAYTTVSAGVDPLKQERVYWFCAPIWQAFNAGNASACTGAACPCLDDATDACVRQGTVISDLPDHVADWFTAYFATGRKARADNRRKFHTADFIAEVSAAVANGTVWTRPQMLLTLDSFYKAT